MLRLFAIESDISELFIRGTFTFWALYFLLRVSGSRYMAAISFSDLFVVVLIASAVGETLSSGSETLFDGMIVACTIIFWSAAVNRLIFYFPIVERVLQPRRVLLIKNGAFSLANMRREFITRAEIEEQLRLNGIEHLDDVKAAYLESTGEISILKKEGVSS